MRPPRPAGAPDGMRFPGRRPTTQEIEGTMEFARDAMPNLFRMIEEMPGRSRHRVRLFGHALREYRQYMAALDSPGESAAVLERARAQDELFALVREFRNAAPEQQDELRRQLRDKMLMVVRDGLREREARIERLREMLEREDRALTDERGRVEETARERVDRLLREAPGGRGEPTTAPDESDAPEKSR